MNCDAVDELLAAYALDAVDDDERAAIEAHLATCDRHEDMGELLATAGGLALLAEDREPSLGLGPRLLASAQPDETRAPRRSGRVLPFRWLGAAAAAVVLVAAGFGAGAVLSRGGNESLVQVVSTDGALVRAEATPGEAPVKVTLSGLRRRPEGEGYQVWVVRDDAWVSVGICNTNENGWWQGDFDFALDDEDLLAVTVEPSGGSTRPSGEVVLIASGGGSAD
ncbi:MAG: anti-sigma factor [Dehalococcoidia bacterium]|nr:anti-sigma factor [Dehalococcoidia bacterium]MCB9491295.1 anti-sigma factor [Dehalococcoidia bacterium]